jgi:hypothetical protein
VTVSGNGTPFSPHLISLLDEVARLGNLGAVVDVAIQCRSLDTPAYVPSNTVVVDPGACAPTGVANARDAIVRRNGERMAVTPLRVISSAYHPRQHNVHSSSRALNAPLVACQPFQVRRSIRVGEEHVSDPLGTPYSDVSTITTSFPHQAATPMDGRRTEEALGSALKSCVDEALRVLRGLRRAKR